MKKILKHRFSLDRIYRNNFEKISRLNKIRLDKNERVNEHSKLLITKLKNSINSSLISSYPEFKFIYNKLSVKLRVKQENIILTAGADQALKNCFEVFYKKQSEIITLDPTYAMVDIYCKAYNTNQVKIPYDKNLQLDINQFLFSINKKTSLIIIANPNSPTGTIIKKDNLEKIIIKSKKCNTIVVIDEAYFEFSNYNSLKFLKKYNNIVIVRTFSKMFGLAGLRLGYVLADKKNIKKLRGLKPMYEGNSVAIKAGEILLDNYSIIKNYLKEMREGEKFAIKFCNRRNIKFIKTYANFSILI